MKVLITGSNGFLGKHVVRELISRGHELLTPSSKEMDLLNPSRLMCECCVDETTLEKLWGLLYRNKVEGVVHLAATCGGIGINKDNPGRFIYENLQMGINVIEASRQADVKKIVNLGTVCSYPKFSPVPFKEEDLWNGYPEETNAPYGIAKKALTEMAIAYHKQYGLNVTNFVPANLAGEYDHFDEYSSHVIPAIIKKFESPIPGMLPNDEGLKGGHHIVLWGTGEASREFLYAGDCARAIGMALERDTGPEPINLGTGREVSIVMLAMMIREIGGYRATNIVWDTSKPDGQPRRSLDVSRAKERLGWEATTSLEETIKRTIDWYRQHGK